MNHFEKRFVHFSRSVKKQIKYFNLPFLFFIMSYLTDEPLSPEEEQFYKTSVRKYYYNKAAKPSFRFTYLNAARNKSRADYAINDFKKLVNDFYKIKLSNNMFIINQTTYDHLLNMFYEVLYGW